MRALELLALGFAPQAGVGARACVRGLTRVLAAVLRHVEGPGPDRYLAPDIEAVVQLACSGEIVEATESVVGVLD